MLYDANNPILRILSVDRLSWKDGNFNVAPRKHSALAFRVHGSAVFKINGKEYCVNERDIVYLPQDLGYSVEYTDTEMIVAHFICENDDSDIEIYSFADGESIYKKFLRLLSVWENKKPAYTVYSMAELYGIFGSILENETDFVLPEHFLNAVSYLNSDFKDSSLRIDEICLKSGIAQTSFRKLFKRYYQKTPIEYVTELRLEHAHNLILNGYSVENASFDSGFADPKYFARVVKKYFGCTPRELKAYGK